MGEVLAGILLGPTLLGAAWPEAKDYLFPPDIVPLLSGAAQIGLAFYLFLVGMELDPRILRERIGQAAFISNTSVAFPMALGFLVAIPIYELLSPDVRLPAVRALHGRRDVRHRLPGARPDPDRAADAQAPGRGALDGGRRDRRRHRVVPARARDGRRGHRELLARTSRSSGSRPSSPPRCCSSAGRLLGRVSKAYDEVGHVPTLWLGVIFVGVLLSAFVAQQIGIAAIFGAFVMGLIMPRRAGLTADVSGALRELRRPRPAAALLRRHRPPDRGRMRSTGRSSGR